MMSLFSTIKIFNKQKVLKSKQILVYVWLKDGSCNFEKSLLNFVLTLKSAEEQAIVLHSVKYHQNIGVFELRIPKVKLKKLRKIPLVNNIFIAPQSFTYEYSKLVNAFERFLSEGFDEYIDVVNISLQPVKLYSYSKNDPIVVATKIIESKGITIVMAAGNFGHLGKNSLSTWVKSSWIISVGATNLHGNKLASFSSIGMNKKRNMVAPTVVAPGINIIGNWPINKPKDKKRQSKDLKLITSEMVFLQTGETVDINDSYLASHTIESGTSQAAPIVSGLCGLIIGLRKNLRLDHTPSIIKDILIEAAEPLMNYGTYKVGAGFIKKDVLVRYFRKLDNNEIESKYWPKNVALIDTMNNTNCGANIAVMDD